jgi:hypothetical protein
MIRILIYSWLIILLCHHLNAQDDADKAFDGSVSSLIIGYGGDLPAGDLKDRFGNNLKFSLGGEHLTAGNWIYNADFIFFFGNNIKEDVLSSFRTNEGYILGDDGLYADVFLRQRGLYLGGGIGRHFQFNDKSRSGVKLTINGGVLQHNIRFVDERNSVAQLRSEGFKGYDRLTRGFTLKESIAFKHLARNRRLNYEIGLDFVQGFTSEVRAINFDTGLPTNKSRLDLMFGIRVAWILPFYHNAQQTVYY